MNELSATAALNGAKKLFVSGLLIAITLAVYGRVHTYEFVNFDDDVHVYQNPNVTSGLTKENIVWAFGIHGPSQWHPLAWLSHQLDCEIFQLWAGGHHLTNLSLHAANVVLLFLVLANVTQSLWKSAFVAAVFAIHPVNVESVVWVSERRNVLAMFFGLLTIASYAAFVRRRSVPRYVRVICPFILALMSKPLVVTLPCVLLLLDFWPFRRFIFQRERDSSATGTIEQPVSLRTAVMEKLPLLLLSVGASVLTILCQKGIIATADALPFPLRVLNALSVYSTYLWKVVWPDNLAVFYPHPGFVAEEPQLELIGPAIMGGLILLAVTAVAIRALKKHPYLAIGWFWYLGTMFPMIGLVQSGQQQMADRYLYLPMIGVLVAVAWTLPELAAERKTHKSWLRLAALIAVPGLAVCSWMQTAHWRNSITLFEQALAVTERNSWAHNNLGLALLQRHRSVEAMSNFAAALQIDPDYGLAHYNLGVALHDQRRLQQAVPRFQEAVRLMPKHVDSRMRLGIVMADMAQIDAAVAHFKEAVRLAPDLPDAHLNLGIGLAGAGNTRDAIRSFLHVLKIDPKNLKAGFHLARALIEVGELTAAEGHLRSIVESAPEFAAAHSELAKLLLNRGLRNQAIRHFREALRIQPTLQDARSSLEAALSE